MSPSIQINIYHDGPLYLPPPFITSYFNAFFEV
jgi:hypothetical protein